MSDPTLHLTTAIADAHNALDVAGAPHVGDLRARIKSLAACVTSLTPDLTPLRLALGLHEHATDADVVRAAVERVTPSPLVERIRLHAVASLLNDIEDAARAHHHVSVATVRAVRALLGVS